MPTVRRECGDFGKQLRPDLHGRLWTRDFTAMYTSLPQGIICKQVMAACEEAFEFEAERRKCTKDEVGLGLTWDYKRKATCQFVKNGKFGLFSWLVYSTKISGAYLYTYTICKEEYV